jgi:heme-degrading monooxygenase HmoA
MATSTLTLRCKPGRRDELLRRFDELGVLEAASTVPGYLGGERTPAPGDDDAVIVTARWESPAAYDAWLADPRRPVLSAAIEPLLTGEPESRLD